LASSEQLVKRGHAVAFHLAAVVGAAFIHRGWHPEQHHEEHVEPASNAVDPPAGAPTRAWADWVYTTSLLILDRPLYTWREEDDLDPEGWSHWRWHEMAIRAEESGDLELALAIRERYRPRAPCGLNRSPEYAAKAYADLCHRLGRRACFLALHVPLLGDVDMSEPDVDFSFIARLPSVGVDRHRFLRGLVYQFEPPEAARTKRPEVEPERLALAIERARLTDVMLPWLRREASNTALDAHNRLRAEQTLHHLREQAGSLLLQPIPRDEKL
jgi:hypothetical protein